jgi:hypothetical protein
MGNGLSAVVQKLIEERKLTRIRPDRKLAMREIAASKADLKLEPAWGNSAFSSKKFF